MESISFKNKPRNFGEYIKYYFQNMVNMSSDKDIFFQDKGEYVISIMKDETKRVLEGTGRLRERPWSNFLFFFINKEQYKKMFGTNSRKRDFVGFADINNTTSFTNWDESYEGNRPYKLNINEKNNFIIAKGIFDKVKQNNPALFIRAYVYITLIIYDETDPITFDNFYPYYLNTNFKFMKTNGKYNFIYNVKYSYLVDNIDSELKVINEGNRDLFECVKAFTGDIEFIDQTKFFLDIISNDIKNKEKYILVEGAARTGKTIIAMSLLNRFPDSKLLLMNYHFYNSLVDAFKIKGIPFPFDRIFHQSYGKGGYYGESSSKISYDFLIVDECQRIGMRYGILNRIINCANHKHAVFLGDDYQKLKPDSDDGIVYIIESLLETENNIKKYKFNKSIGMPPHMVKNIKYLLGLPEAVNPYPLGEYNIEFFSEEKEFFDSYEANVTQKKHIATIQLPYYNHDPIGKFEAYPKSLNNRNFPFFLNKEIVDKYYLSPFQMISREVECMYIYVRDNITLDKIYNYVLTNLYVLMTRATISLKMYFQNKETRQYFSERLKDIEECENISFEDYDPYMNEEDTQFIVKGDIIEKFLDKYQIKNPKNNIESRFITRLVHFTDADNVDRIIENGIIPRKELEENNINYNFNDEVRLDGKPSAISLSIQNPNISLLNAFKKRKPSTKYKLISIDPSILYSSFFINNKQIRLTKRTYCNYNAASNSTYTSDNNMNIMFTPSVETYHATYYRSNKSDNATTSNQAEILFFGKIPVEFIDGIEDI